ncbi:MAG: tRNA (N6-threonylcarbamoyladenosine(37)-N6)-methyltransferase TrmO [Bdellovibrionales bacterium]
MLFASTAGIWLHMDFQPIGYIQSCFKEKFGTPRQPSLVPESTASLKIRSDLQPQEALVGLEQFSHVWVIFEFHKNANKKFYPKVSPPRLNGETMGLFATRSPHRPNPIGLSCVKLERIEGDTLYFSGIDLIDGTPVLDIKPYVVSVDSVPQATVGWLDKTENKRLDVSFSEEAMGNLQDFQDKNLKTMITQILENDPRNSMDRELSRQNKTLGFYLGEANVVFSVEATKAIVIRIESRHTKLSQ